ncbi:MAG TPA: hypothetical protein VFE47_02840 [Tepidisphaeraceae bacterium]|nr:hypothetical protein [Tepidisphaeraceae bacterium]
MSNHIHQLLPARDDEVPFGRYYNYAPLPIPAIVDLEWKSSDGQQHAKRIEVDRLLPQKWRFSGTICLKFFDSDVCVIPVPRWMEERNQRLGKATVP